MTQQTTAGEVSVHDGPVGEYEATRIGPLRPAGAFSDALIEAAKTRPDIVCLSADLAEAVDMADFAAAYPDRFFSTGVAEQNLVAVAAGMARAGLTPVATTFTGFMVRRAHDFTVMQVGLTRTNVKLVGGKPGIQQKWGTSHAGYEDLAVMRAMPGMLVIEPADKAELGEATKYMLEYDGPVYMRLPLFDTSLPERPSGSFAPGRIQVLRDGHDAVIFASGLMVERALAAARQLKSEGVDAAVANVSTLKPLDEQTVIALAAGTRAVVTAENHSTIGGLGDAVASVLAVNAVYRPLQKIGLKDEFPEFGSVDYLSRLNNMQTSDVADAVQRGLRLAANAG